tara:strand:+ start:2676 stop:3005 length:330 start_codon:yes stop_codon:yes gene_type:complete
MQIQLKQTEIITALKQFITSQGIDLWNKEVTVTFTAGRKESGISAEIDIEENALPDFSGADDDEAPAPKAAVLSMVPLTTALQQSKTEPTTEAEATKSAEPLKTNSLFS